MATTAGSLINLPGVGTLGPDEVRIMVSGPVDDWGRARFTAFWIGTDALRQGQVRGQAFHMVLVDFIAAERGKRRLITAYDQATADLIDQIGAGYACADHEWPCCLGCGDCSDPLCTRRREVAS